MRRATGAYRSPIWIVALLAPVGLLACSGSFSAGGADGDASAGDEGGVIVVGEGGSGPDGSRVLDASVPDARHDATAPDSGGEDGASDGAPGVDGSQADGSPADGSPADGSPADAEPDSAMGDSAPGDSAPEAEGCPTGYLDCSTCVPNDVNNCGTCGHDCATLPHVSGGVTCGAGGVCTFTNADCSPGWSHCTSTPDDGCETNITASPNCGACGVTCSGGTPVCDGTGCVSGCSASTPTLCGGTTCVNTTNDPQNCNGCSLVCPAGPANSQPTCSSSACGYACNGGYSPCNGACVNEQIDPSNCNGCGAACPTATNGQPTCTGGVCGMACNTGLSYCPTEAACVNEQTDPNNCNGCGSVCSTGVANAVATCSGGVCGYACDANFTSCTNDSTCDDLQTDPAHCGGCTDNCNVTQPPPAGATATCTGGACDFQCATGHIKCEASWECFTPAGAGAYVQAGASGTAGSCGASSNPCAKIQDGIAFALAQGLGMVYVASGTYDESLTIDTSNSLTVQGGWTVAGGTWTQSCPVVAGAAKVVAPAGSTQVLLVNGTGSVTLDDLELQMGSGGTGQSVYGLFAASGTVDVRNAVIVTGDGGAGASGANGAAAGSAPTTCGAGPGANAGTPGTAGASATSHGTYGASGYLPVGGGAAGPGGTGDNGTAAINPCSPCNAPYCYTGQWCFYSSIQRTCLTNEAVTSCGSQGTNGCGGPGGQPGTVGTGAGSSVGIYTWSASVTVDGLSGSITVGNGGAGGDGGAGGSGASGRAGASGKTATGQPACSLASCNNTCTDTNCSYGQGGPAGGSGLAGGAGGNAGGGAGGDSYCYVTGPGGGGSVSYTLPSSTCAPGSAGVGGTQGTGGTRAVSGNAGIHN